MSDSFHFVTARANSQQRQRSLPLYWSRPNDPAGAAALYTASQHERSPRSEVAPPPNRCIFGAPYKTIVGGGAPPIGAFMVQNHRAALWAILLLG